MSETTAAPTTTEALPVYDQDQVPQSAFDALLTRITALISTTHFEARAVLESFVERQKAPAYNRPEETEPPKPIDHSPPDAGSSSDVLTRIKQQIVKELFNAITREDNEAIALLIQHNLVIANITSEAGQTPLLEAISTRSIPIVKELLNLGANPNAFGVVDQAMRTPLMLAASIGSLPLVKLLFEPPHFANDALVAPDGQIALRLAAAAGHSAIVDYLPSRRAGGFLRYKTQNADNIARMKAALRKIGTLIKFFIWDVPKFFVWSIPKHVVVRPFVKCCKWCWANRKNFGPWCKHLLSETWKGVARSGKAVWKGIKKIPEAVKEMGKGLWKFGTETVPRWVKKFAIWLWKLVIEKIPEFVKEMGKGLWKFGTETVPRWVKKLAIWLWKLVTEKIPEFVREVGKGLWKFGTKTLPRWVKKLAVWLWKLVAERIPKAILIALKWTWAGISSLGQATWDIILKIVSLLHTVLEAILTLLGNVRLKDIWNAFSDVLRAVFVTFPLTLRSWVQKFGEASYRIMATLFGCFGELLWWIVVGLKDLVLYVPGKLLIILQSIGGSFAKAGYEIRVWISPKVQ